MLSSIALLSILPSSSSPRICPVFSLTVGGVTIHKDDPSTVEALVGQTVVLPCRVSPPPSSTVSVEWRRDGVPLSTNRSGETLPLSSIVYIKAGVGEWKCCGELWSIGPAREPIRENVAQEWCSQRPAPRLSSFQHFLSNFSLDITSSQTVPCWSAPSPSSTLVGSCAWQRGSRRETTVTFTFLPQVLKWHFMKITFHSDFRLIGARFGQNLNLSDLNPN